MAGIVNEAYTLDVNVQEAGSPEQSVNVRAWNTSDTSIIDKTTDVNGDITSTIVIAKEHSITGTSTLATTDFNPFNVRALKWLLEVLDVSINLSAPSKQTLFMNSNSNITQTNQGTVQGYTGETYNHTTDTLTLDGSGVSPLDNVDELYDRSQDEAIVNEQPTPPQVMFTLDSQNYTIEYDFVIDGFSFAGQNRSITLAAGKDLTVQGSGGIVNNITVTGDYLLNTEANLSNVTVNGDLRINTGLNSVLSFSNVTVTGNVWNDAASNTLTINATGSSLTAGDPGTGNGQTNVQASVPVSVTATKDGTPVEGAAVYLKTTGGTEVLNGLTNASGVLSGTFSGSTPASIDSDVSGVKASSGPIPYQYFPLGGTIESGTGYSASALLVED